MSTADLLPRSDVFDILPQLHELLSRIDHHVTNEDASSANNDSVYVDSAPLEPRDLAKEALTLKTKIRKTLRELEKLPDMDKTVGEQELEIQELERRIGLQQAMLSRLRAAGNTSAG